MAKKSKFPVLAFEKDARRGTVIRAEFSEFNGKNLLNIREWWTDDADELKPGKGFTIPANKSEEFLLELKSWAEEMLEVIPASDDKPAKKKKKQVEEDDEDEDDEDGIVKGSTVYFIDAHDEVVEGVVKKIIGNVAVVKTDEGKEQINLAHLSLEKPKKPKKGKKAKKKDDDDLVDLDDDEDEPVKKKKKSKKDDGKKKKRKATSL